MATARNMLTNGLTSGVEIESGMFVELGTPEHRTRVTGFRWRGQLDKSVFDTDGPKWEDFTDNPTLGDRQDLLMIGHSGVWRPGVASRKTDGRLVDVKTGRCRPGTV